MVNPLRDAARFVGDAVAAAVAAGHAVDEVIACGHSWGGALSEAQVAVGDAGGLPIWGVGFASPGFSEAIRRLGNELGRPVDAARVAGEITHYVRRYDVVPVLGSGHLGQRVRIGAVYLQRRRDSGPHAMPKPPISPSAEAHNCWLYFGYFHVPEDQHVMIKLNGAVSVEEGRDP